MNNDLFIGVDGGGTKTEIWLSDSQGKVISQGLFNSSNLRNVGLDNSVLVVVEGIKKCLGKRKQVKSVFIALAGIEEEFKSQKKEIEKRIVKCFPFLKNKVVVGSDQEAAFFSATDEKEGIVVISGTGSVVRGWKKGKDVKSSGWGWLADEGSACWVGQQVYQLWLKQFDGREKKTVLFQEIKRKIKIKTPEDLNRFVYLSPVNLAYLSLIADSAAQKKDKKAQEILIKAGQELSLATLVVIKKLDFKKKVPLVLIGGMFNSLIFKKSFKKEIDNQKVVILTPLQPPVYGALKLSFKKK